MEGESENNNIIASKINSLTFYTARLHKSSLLNTTSTGISASLQTR
jgi:hypothetical protein